jgi:NAD(P)-dependent dehydrogenase (short-subunit alcohol dehydrogenase family)/acyl dehydratase/putative sterol carrier protein
MALKLDSIGAKIGPSEKVYDWKDVVLYALGVGAGFDELDYVYEKKLKVIPTFSIAAVFDFLAAAAIESNANFAGILHGAQEIIFHNKFPTEGTLKTEGEIKHIWDKGEKGAVVVAEADTYHSSGDKLFTNVFTLFCRKDGGFGGDSGPKEDWEVPDREPDFVQDAEPSIDQPLVYRLSGDMFDLHVDPEFAKRSGFKMPIMHGLCTFGYACRAAIGHLFPGEPERMTRFKVRFSKTLYPGIPIRTMVWKLDEGHALFRVLNTENGEVVIDRGEVDWISPEQVEDREAKKGVRFDDRVAVVTGAGGGLGRQYALGLAARGAKVVVNDFGGAMDGTGGGQTMADKVVDEVTAAGGTAVANYDSVATVEGGQAIVDQAIEVFGRIDILVNNAGILRDKSMVKMKPEHWAAVRSVHLDGAFHVTKPAFALMKAQGYGRIVMTTSAAGLHGNFGQSNYSAAKMGLVGFMNTLELEGAKYDVKVNTIAPLATTRLTETILPPNLLDDLKPDFVAPLVLFLCSEDCPVNGRIYNAGAGFYSRAAVVSGPGEMIDVPTLENVSAAWKKIAAIKPGIEAHDAMAAIGQLMEAGKVPPEEDKPAAKKGGGGGGPDLDGIFKQMPDVFQADAAAGVEVVFQYTISGGGGGDWYSVIKDQTCEVSKGKHDAPTTTIKMEAGDFADMLGGKLNPMAAYTSGKLVIEGDLMKSQLIEKLFKF